MDAISPGITEAEFLDAAGYPCVSENPIAGGVLRSMIFNTVEEGLLQDGEVIKVVCYAVNVWKSYRQFSEESILRKINSGRRDLGYIMIISRRNNMI